MADQFRNVGDGITRQLIDQFAWALTVIDSEHRLIHDGMLFTANYRFDNLANGGNLDILLQVPAGSFPHLRAWSYSLEDGPCEFNLYENPTFSAAGTAITLQNNNRNSSNTSDVTATHTPTITSPGDAILEGQYIPDPGGGFLSGSPGAQAQDLSEEWVLKQNEDYLLRLTNNSGVVIDGSIYFVLYEIDYNGE